MKKLMFMLAAVACAVTMQAAQLDWSLAAKSIYQPGSTTAYLTGQTSYLLVFASSEDADTLYSNLKDGTKTIAQAIALAVDNATGGTTTKKAGQIESRTASSSI